MHPLLKAFIACLFLAGGIAWTLYFFDRFLTVLLGFLGPFVALVAAFVVWLELDEWKIERELKAEEKPKKRIRKRK